jgi:hypothetical protein
MQRTIIWKWAKRTAFAVGAIIIILSGVLAIHIYQVTNRPKGGVDGWQMARIDFKEPVDSQKVSVIRAVLHEMNGIHHSLANIPEGTLVYAYDPNLNDSKKVFSAIVQVTGVKAERFIVDETTLSNGCPVIDKNSITYRISSGFQKLFTNN